MSGAERLLWLLGEEDPPDGAPNLAEEALAVTLGLSAWQVLPWVAPRLAVWAGPARSQARRLAEDVAVAVHTHARLQIRMSHRIQDAFSAAGMDFVLLKGAAVRAAIWPDPTLRGGWDTDLGVLPGRGREAEALGRSLGFTPVWIRPEDRAMLPIPRLNRALFEARHYELCMMVREAVIEDLSPAVQDAIRRALPLLKAPIWTERGGELVARSSLDLHFGIGPTTGVAMMMRDAEERVVHGRRALCPPVEAMALHAAQKLVRERAGLHQLADLGRLLPRVVAEGRQERLERLLWAELPELPARRLLHALDQGRLSPVEIHAALLGPERSLDAHPVPLPPERGEA